MTADLLDHSEEAAWARTEAAPEADREQRRSARRCVAIDLGPAPAAERATGGHPDGGDGR